MEDLYTKNSIRTSSGVYFDITEMRPDDINIEDIAHALSFQCRFSGHLPVFYSVAQHSVLCALHVTDKFKKEALLHDASEAYLLDIPSPIKHLLPDYKKLEAKLMSVIAEKFGFTYPLTETVKEIDKYMLEQEWHGIMLGEFDFPCWSPEKAKQEFIDLYKSFI